MGMKIAVIGYSGAGKSTLAAEFSRRCSIPLLYLDKVQFTDNWCERDRAEVLSMVEDFMAQDDWVIDGNYTGFHYERRLLEADHIVFLDFSRLTCLWQALRRYREFRGGVRESMADGCCEKMDWEFLRWILWEGRNVKRREHFRQVCRRYPEKVTVLKNRGHLEHFLAHFPT